MNPANPNTQLITTGEHMESTEVEKLIQLADDLSYMCAARAAVTNERIRRGGSQND